MTTAKKTAPPEAVPTGPTVDFDDLLAESQRPPVDVIVAGRAFAVAFPTGRQAKLIDAAAEKGDDVELMRILFGPDNGDELVELMADAPADLPGKLMGKIWEKFGITPGNLAG